jgi:hypothetical protein
MTLHRTRFGMNHIESLPNQVTGPNAGGPRQFTIQTPLAARVGQFWRSALSRV